MPAKKSRLSPQQLQAIEAAMAEANGSYAAAARRLGIPAERLRDYCRDNPDLQHLKGTARTIREAEVPDSSNALQREMTMDKDDLKAIEYLDRDNKAFMTALDLMGVKSRERREMVSGMQKAYGTMFGSMVEMMGGGMSKQFIDTMEEIDELRKVIQSEEVADNVKLQAVLREDRRGLLQLSIAMVNTVNKAAMVKAFIKEKEAAVNSGKNRKPKGFLAIQNQPGATVNVSTNGEES